MILNKFKVSISRLVLLKKSSLPHFSNKSMRLFYCGVTASLFLIAVLVPSYQIYRQHEELNGPTAIKNLIQINKLQADLAGLESTVSSDSALSDQEIGEINSKITTISSQIQAISNKTGLDSSSEIQKIQSNLNESNTNLNQKISALDSEIKDIKTKINPPSSLSQEALPFVVVSVDLWNGVPKAQVEQKQDETQIGFVGLNQSLGGWKVADISAATQSVTFVNVVNQVVQVQVKGF